jgi:hypothetical protein
MKLSTSINQHEKNYMMHVSDERNVGYPMGSKVTDQGRLHPSQLVLRYLLNPILIDSKSADVSQPAIKTYSTMLNSYLAWLGGFFATTAAINNDEVIFTMSWIAGQLHVHVRCYPTNRATSPCNNIAEYRVHT